ncbi:MAG: hypothetical protein ACRCX2_28770 [Paraclostridium sp.]
MSFNNYMNPSKVFDSFNGTELKCYMKVPKAYDEYGQLSDFALVEMGNISAISAVDQYSASPVPAIGHSRPIGISIGSSIVTGSMSFEALEHGFVNEVKRILKEAGIRKISLNVSDDQEDLKFGYSEIGEINDFPMVDIVIIGVKENDINKKIQKEIVGIRFNREGSGIGVNQLAVRESYSFLAQSMTDFKPVTGINEDPIGDDVDIYETGIFG